MNATATISRPRMKAKKKCKPSLAGSRPTSPIDATPATEVRHLPIELIDPSPLNPRDDAAEDLEQLRPSIEAADVITPITVRPLSPSRYEVVCGERRWRAAKAAGKTTIAAVVRNLTDDQALELSLIENVCRKDLNPVQLAHAIRRLNSAVSTKPGPGCRSLRQIAALFGKSPGWCVAVLQVLRLPEALQKRVAAGKLKVAHARVLAPLADRPDLLKEIERQMDEAPGLWETKVGFHRGVELVKQQDAKRGTNPKPPRAPQSRLAADGGNVADQVAPALLDPPATAAAVEERADQELSQAAYDAGRKACVAGEPRELASPASDEELADWQRGWDDADRSSPDAAGSDGRPIDGRHGHMTPAGFKRFHSAAMEVRQAQSEARADLVDQIVALIGQITTWRQLDAVKVALKARSAELLQGAS